MSNALLEITTEAELAEKLTEGCLDQMHVKRSAVTFFRTAVPYRMAWRYGERGYRYLHVDAGHVCQNLYLEDTPDFVLKNLDPALHLTKGTQCQKNRDTSSSWVHPDLEKGRRPPEWETASIYLTSPAATFFGTI